MTRINANLRAKLLCDQHLLAEHREIVRIPNTIKSGKAVVKNIPTEFKLGAGHVKFFYDKLQFLHSRYLELHNECLKRGFNVSNYAECFHELPPHLYNSYLFTEDENLIIKHRIEDRLKSMRFINFYSNRVTTTEAINILNTGYLND